MNKVLIEVKDEHIEHGIMSSTECPVHQACRFYFGKEQVKVLTYGIRIKDKQYRLPEIVSQFIKEFDAGLSVSAFCFELVLNEVPVYEADAFGVN